MSAAQPRPIILELGSDFYDEVAPAHFPEAKLRFFNKEKADFLGLYDVDAKKHFHDFAPFQGNIPSPLALRYHGHQFHVYNPELGDGRGFLHSQFQADGKIYDLGTKGSGQTPYSRGGDGRLTLKGAFREALATELLEKRGVNTSKTFCVFETGEQLQRNDEPSPTRSAVLTRMSHSHIRFGTFQRLAFLDQPENIKKLLNYCVKYYYPELLGVAPIDSTELASQFLQSVVQASAKLTAQWMMAGLVHGVLNSDNMNITAESFDYGPYRFMPNYDPNFTAAYFDHAGLYRYGRQPHSVFWNLQRLAESLLPAFPDLDLTPIINNYGTMFSNFTVDQFFLRLNLKRINKSLDEDLFGKFFELLQTFRLPFEQTFFDFHSGYSRKQWEKSDLSNIYLKEDFKGFLELLKQFSCTDERLSEHDYYRQGKACDLLIDEIESIWKHIETRDDWSLFEQKIQQIRSLPDLRKSP